MMQQQPAGAGSGIMPHVLAQQGLGNWQPPLGGYPAPIIVPMAMGNLNQSGESKEVFEMRKRLDEEVQLRRELITQNSRELTCLRGDYTALKQKRKMLEDDLSSEKKKRKEIEISLDKVKEERWYAVKELKDKGKELEKAEKSLADIKAELVKERERRKIAEKLEKEQRMKRANEKKEVHLLKEKLKEKKLVKEHSNKVSDEDCFEDEWKWEGRGVGMVMSKRRPKQSSGRGEQEISVNGHLEGGDAVAEEAKGLAKKEEKKGRGTGGKAVGSSAKGGAGSSNKDTVEVRQRQIQCPRCEGKVCIKKYFSCEKMYLLFQLFQ